MINETLLILNYITNFHWIWYGLGFVMCPRLTIMIALSIYARNLNIPLPLMIIGWIYVIFISPIIFLGRQR
jgi:hypothetical protein